MTNVRAKDLAILVKPTFPENQDKICTVEKAIPPTKINQAKLPDQWWFVTFPQPVKTSEGMYPFASIHDSCLRRIAGPSIPNEDLVRELEEELV